MHARASYILTILLTVFFNLVFSSAHAQVSKMTDCDKSPFSGSWVSADPDEPFLYKLEISDVCKQIITKPVAMDNPWAGALGAEKRFIHRAYTISPSSACSPIDCAWGRARGKLTEKGKLKAQFRMFWSERFIELTPVKQGLHVSWRIEYIGRKKPDQLGERLLVRAQ